MLNKVKLCGNGNDYRFDLDIDYDDREALKHVVRVINKHLELTLSNATPATHSNQEAIQSPLPSNSGNPKNSR